MASNEEAINGNGEAKLEREPTSWETMEKNEEEKIEEPKYRGIKAIPFILGNETFERLGSIGTTSNLLVYLITVFNMSSISATNLIYVFNGTSNFGSLVGAFVSDTYFGRYKTLGGSCIISFLGMLFLTLTAAIPKLHPNPCGTEENSRCSGPSPGQYAFLLSAFALMIIGGSGIRPCNLAFGADQFNPNKESGRRGINSYFNWYYFTFTFAQMISLTLIVYVQSNVNWALGLAIPTVLMFCSCIVFFVGSFLYVKVPPEGSPLTSMAQVAVAAIRKRRLDLPEQPEIKLFNHFPAKSINSKLSYTAQFRCLSKAAIIAPEDQINPDGTAADPWRLCTVQRIEELKCILRIFPIWAAGVVYYVVLAQMVTYSVFQAMQSNRRLGNTNFHIPAASYAVFSMLSLSLFIPIWDQILIPFLRKITGKEEGITILQRTGVGMVINIVTMIVSAVVEQRRRTTALTHPTLGLVPRKGAISAMSGSLLIPQLALTGLSEAFTVIGQVEFFYKEFPENMRSFAGSFLYCGFAVAGYLSSALISVVNRVTEKSGTSWLAEDLNKGRVDYFYYLVAILQVLNLGYYLMCAKWFKYKESHGNQTAEVAMENLQGEKAEA